MPWYEVGLNTHTGLTQPTVWTDLDLSSWVGSQRCLVKLTVTPVIVSSLIYSIDWRTNGDADDLSATSNNDTEGAHTSDASPAAGQSGSVLVWTDENGVVEYIRSGPSASTGRTFDLWVDGYYEMTYSNTSVTGFTGSDNFTDLDLSSVVGSNEAFVYLKIKQTAFNAGGGLKQIRPKSESSSSPQGGTIGADFNAVSTTKHMFCVTNSSGVIQEKLGSSGDYLVTVVAYDTNIGTTLQYVTGWDTPATLPTSWTDLDLSNVVGSNKTIVLLRYYPDKVATGTDRIGTRPNGIGVETLWTSNYIKGVASESTATNNVPVYLVANTDANGVIEHKATATNYDFTIQVVAYAVNNEAPVLSSQSPTGSEEDPDVTVSVSFTDDMGISATGIDVVLTDPSNDTHNAVVSGVFQTGYSGSLPSEGATSGSVTVSTHPYFAEGSWTSDIDITDQGSLTGNKNWSFTVVAGYYRNRVYDSIAGDFVRWKTKSADVTGNSYPGPDAFGNTEDYCVEHIEGFEILYRNRVFDTQEDGYITWETTSPDTTGNSYPGPGSFGVDTSDYTVERITDL
jgi:hypothetical protein